MTTQTLSQMNFLKNAERTTHVAFCDACGKVSEHGYFKVGNEHGVCIGCYAWYAECDVCGHLFKKSKLTEIDGERYCVECRDDGYTKCENCNTWLDNDDDEILEHDGENFCEECFYESHFTCEDCGDVYDMDDSCDSNGNGLYCQSCFDERYFRCYNCGEIESTERMLRGADDYNYCEDCWSENFGTCENCGELYSQDDLRYDGQDGVSYCSDCDEGEHGALHSYSYRPHFEYYKTKNEVDKGHRKQLYLGVELEVEHSDESEREQADIVTGITDKLDISDKLYMKTDGSLTQGIEIVSMPMTYNYMKQNMEVKDMLQKMRKAGFTSYDNGHAGLHVHMSRSQFTDGDITKLQHFFYNNKQRLYKFSQRKSESYAHYLQPQSIRHNTTTGHRYEAVNLCNSNTIEIRIFRGTLDYNRYWASIQFCVAVAEYIKQVSIAYVVKKDSWIGFMEYIENRYGHLYKYLKSKSL